MVARPGMPPISNRRANAGSGCAGPTRGTPNQGSTPSCHGPPTRLAASNPRHHGIISCVRILAPLWPLISPWSSSRPNVFWRMLSPPPRRGRARVGVRVGGAPRPGFSPPSQPSPARGKEHNASAAHRVPTAPSLASLRFHPVLESCVHACYNTPASPQCLAGQRPTDGEHEAEGSRHGQGASRSTGG